jgi:DNA-binding transcriptional MerR regulator
MARRAESEADPIPDRQAFKIGEASALVGVRAHVLRFWEQEFPMLSPSKGATGHRVYSREEVVQLRRLRTLLYDRGYTIAGARALMEAGAVAVDNALAGRPAEVAAAAEAAEERVVALQAELTAAAEARRGLEKALARAREEATFWRAETRRAERGLAALRAAILEEAHRLEVGSQPPEG